MFKKTASLLADIFVSFFSQPAIASSHTGSLKNLGMNEIMFPQGMIPHGQQAIDMSTSALKRSSNPKEATARSFKVTGVKEFESETS